MAIAARLLEAGQKILIRLGVGALLLAAYAAAGYYLLPAWIQARLLPELSKSLGAELGAERVEFDPFGFVLEIRGFSLKDRTGRELAVFPELSADVDVPGSLKAGRPVLDGRLVEPVLRPELDARGRLNFEALVPEGEGGGAVPFLVTRFAVERGRVEFRDASRGKSYTAILDGMILDLENLGPEPDRKAAFRWAAAGENRESFSVEGTLSLSPVVSEGKLEVAGLDPGVWLERLFPDSSWQFRSGRIGGKAGYRVRYDRKIQWDIHSGEGAGEGLELAARGGGPWLKLGSVAAAGFSYSPADGRARLDSMTVKKPETPWGKAAALTAEGGSFDPAGQTLKLASAAIREAETPSGNIAALSGQGIAYMLPERRLNLDSATAREAVAPWLKLGSAAAERLSYDLAEQRFKLASATLQEFLAPPEPDSRPPRGRVGECRPDADKYQPRRARIGSLQVSAIDGSFSHRSLAVDSVVSERAEFDLQRLPGGGFRVCGLPALPMGPQNGDAHDSPWNVDIAAVRLQDYSLGFRDETVEPPVRVNFGPAALRLTDFSTRRRNLFEFYLNTGVGESGRIEVDGQARLEPFQVDLRFGVDKLWLRSLQSYWHDFTGFDLQRGRLNLWGDITVLRDADYRVDYSGGADIVDLEAVDRKERLPLLRWSSLKFDGLVVHSRPRRFAVRAMTAEQPYMRVVIGADGRLNLARDLVKPAGTADRPPSKASAAERWPVVVGLLRATDGRMDFSDLTLKPGFVAAIQGLNGNISGLSSQENARANLLMAGRINGSSPVKIYGQINPFQFRNHTDVTLEFRNLNLTTLSPYSSKFAGYRIEKGKLDMNLRYKLRDHQLEAENRVVLDQLHLGERVDSRSATTLPVDLAIALLKDREGRIDFDLPVSGSLDDPEFSLGSLYGNALTQFFTKLVTSPFTLLGNLAKSGDESLAFVKFLPGQKSLTSDEKDKLGKVAAALKARPGLALNIKGAADVHQDRLALADQALLRQLKTARQMELRALGQRVRNAEMLDLSDEDYRRLFTRLYRQRHPDAPELRSLAGETAPVLDGPSFQLAKRKLVEQWTVNEMELRLLAQARGESIRDYLVREGGLPDQRIYLLDVRLDPPGEREIGALLSLSGS